MRGLGCGRAFGNACAEAVLFAPAILRVERAVEVDVHALPAAPLQAASANRAVLVAPAVASGKEAAPAAAHEP